MKVKICDLQPNPFRDMKNYPINEEKVKSLIKSIYQTGFWDNILARLKPKHSTIIENKENESIAIGPKFKESRDSWEGMNLAMEDKTIAVCSRTQTNPVVYERPIIEIAYGHHRLIALQRNLKPDFIVNIPVKELDDSTMIRIMANENDESWGTNPKITNETVRVARKYINSSPEKKNIYQNCKDFRLSREAKAISNWLNGNWTEKRVYYSLKHIDGFENGSLNKDATELMPKDTYARRYERSIKKHKIEPKKQKEIAEEILEREDFSEEGIEDVVLEKKYGKRDEPKESQKSKQVEFVEFLKETTEKIYSLKKDLKRFLNFKDEVEPKFYKKEIFKFIESLAILDHYIQKFKKGETHDTQNANAKIE